MSRNARFVSAAKGLLAVQVAGCVGAAGVTAWAAFEVRDMVRERDALAARVAQLEAVIPPQSLPPPPTAIETEAPPPPPDEAQPPSPDEAEAPAERDPVVNRVGPAPNPPPPPPSPTTQPCQLTDANRTATQCPLPLVRDAQYCLDIRSRIAYCPGEAPPPAPPSPTPTPPAPPAPPRDCRRVDGRAVVCVPPFTRTPVRGVCVDGRARPVRCPANTPIQAEPRKTDGQQQPPTRR